MSLPLGLAASSLARTGALTLAAAALTAGLVATQRTAPTRSATSVSAPLPPVASKAPQSSPPAPPPMARPAPALPATQTWLMASVAGQTFLQLAALPHDAALPAHQRGRVLRGDGERAWVAALAPAAAEPAWTQLVGQRVITDTGCLATITDLALVSRLTGDEGYAGLDHPFTPADVRDLGARMVAARLDGCADGRYASAAARPAAAPEPLDRPWLTAAARRAVEASPAARAADEQWSEAGADGSWHEQARWDLRVLRHPRTGVTWVLAHATVEMSDCGTPVQTVLAVFLADDRGGLTAMSITRLDEQLSLDAVLDADGDGRFDMMGTPWPGTDRVLLRGDGSELSRLDLAFYGCPC